MADPLGAEQAQGVPDRLAARWSRRRGARCAGRPRGPGRSAAGTRPRDADLRAAEPEARPARPGGCPARTTGSRRPRACRSRRGCRRSSAARCRSRARAPIRASSIASQNASTGIPRLTEVYGVNVSSAYRTCWWASSRRPRRSASSRPRCGSGRRRPGRLDEVREVAELEEAASSFGIGRAPVDARVALGQLRDDRGAADPTWWTCSSALGSPAMKAVRSVGSVTTDHSARHGRPPDVTPERRSCGQLSQRGILAAWTVEMNREMASVTPGAEVRRADRRRPADRAPRRHARGLPQRPWPGSQIAQHAHSEIIGMQPYKTGLAGPRRCGARRSSWPRSGPGRPRALPLQRRRDAGRAPLDPGAELLDLLHAGKQRYSSIFGSTPR